MGGVGGWAAKNCWYGRGSPGASAGSTRANQAVAKERPRLPFGMAHDDTLRSGATGPAEGPRAGGREVGPAHLHPRASRSPAAAGRQRVHLPGRRHRAPRRALPGGPHQGRPPIPQQFVIGSDPRRGTAAAATPSGRSGRGPRHPARAGALPGSGGALTGHLDATWRGSPSNTRRKRRPRPQNRFGSSRWGHRRTSARTQGSRCLLLRSFGIWLLSKPRRRGARQLYTEVSWQTPIRRQIRPRSVTVRPFRRIRVKERGILHHLHAQGRSSAAC